ncbi:DUF1648 domain-containing protein [Isosphaeraceae bacterium EP7]
MLSLKSGMILLIGLYVVLAAVAVGTEPMLPARVATHFSVSGVPDGWMSRRAQTISSLGVAAFLVLATSVPLYLARHFSDSTVNLPHREYWLAPERRDATFAHISGIGVMLACLSLVLMISLQILVVRANLRTPVRLPASEGFGLIVAFLAGVGAILFFGFRPFHHLPDTNRLTSAAPPSSLS